MTATTVQLGGARDRLQQLCDLERWAQALPLAGRLIGEDPEDDVAWCLLARCLLGLGRPGRALEAAASAIALAPDQEWPHRLASYAASCLGRHDEAVRSAREAVRLEPGLWQTHARLAGAAAQHPQGAREAGLAADRAMELAPYEPQVQVLFGSIAAAAGRPEVAEQAYRAALALDPQDAGAHHLLAALALRSRSGPRGLARAATGFATALSVDPAAQVNRFSLELALRTFLGRATYFLFFTSYLGLLFGTGPSLAARVLPALLLVAPALFVADFLRSLDPQSRRYLGRLLRPAASAVAAGLGSASVVLVLIGMVLPGPWRIWPAAGAAALALAARLALIPDTRRLLRSNPRRGHSGRG